MGWVNGQPHFKDQIEEMATKQIRTISLKILRGVISRTPVDTGRLKSNWQSGVDTVPTSKQENVTDPTQKGTFDIGNFESKSRLLKRIDLDTGTVYIVNNLPYAVPIEEGHGVNNNPGVMVKATLAALGLG